MIFTLWLSHQRPNSVVFFLFFWSLLSGKNCNKTMASKENAAWRCQGWNPDNDDKLDFVVELWIWRWSLQQYFDGQNPNNLILIHQNRHWASNHHFLLPNADESDAQKPNCGLYFIGKKPFQPLFISKASNSSGISLYISFYWCNNNFNHQCSYISSFWP